MKRLGLGVLTILGVGLLVAVLFAPSAKADAIDFSCGSGGCGAGTVTISGGNFSGSGITVVPSSSPATYAFDGDTFDLAFNTTTGNVALIGTGAASGEDFTGTINSFVNIPAGSEDTLILNATWAPLPAGAAAFLGSSTGGDQGTVGFVISGGAANSVDVSIFPAPEPGLLGLLCSGLVGVGLIGLRRRELVA
jgi:hypothetical protein